MPGFNYIESDEVHTPARYIAFCFSFLGGPLLFAFSALRSGASHVATYNHVFPCRCLQVYRAMLPPCLSEVSAAGHRVRPRFCFPPDCFSPMDLFLPRGSKYPGPQRHGLPWDPGSDSLESRELQLEKAIGSQTVIITTRSLELLRVSVAQLDQPHRHLGARRHNQPDWIFHGCHLFSLFPFGTIVRVFFSACRTSWTLLSDNLDPQHGPIKAP